VVDGDGAATSELAIICIADVCSIDGLDLVGLRHEVIGDYGGATITDIVCMANTDGSGVSTAELDLSHIVFAF